MFSLPNLIGGILFSGIGLAAFVYGKRQKLWGPSLIGLALMLFPYFVGNTWVLYALGILLTAGLFVFRD